MVGARPGLTHAPIGDHLRVGGGRSQEINRGALVKLLVNKYCSFSLSILARLPRSAAEYGTYRHEQY